MKGLLFECANCEKIIKVNEKSLQKFIDNELECEECKDTEYFSVKEYCLACNGTGEIPLTMLVSYPINIPEDTEEPVVTCSLCKGGLTSIEEEELLKFL